MTEPRVGQRQRQRLRDRGWWGQPRKLKVVGHLDSGGAVGVGDTTVGVAGGGIPCGRGLRCACGWSMNER